MPLKVPSKDRFFFKNRRFSISSGAEFLTSTASSLFSQRPSGHLGSRRHPTQLGIFARSQGICNSFGSTLPDQGLRDGKDDLSFIIDMGVSQNRGTPKWMVYDGKLENPIKIHDLGVPLFF